MEAFGIDPDELAATLQRRFQSSASVTRLPGKTETGSPLQDVMHDLSEFACCTAANTKASWSVPI